MNTKTDLKTIFPALADLNDKIKMVNGKLILDEQKAQELIATGVPTGHGVNTVVPNWEIPINSPNAIVFPGGNIPMVYLNNDEVSGAFASGGNELKILEIYSRKILALVPYGNGPTGINNTWLIGYFEQNYLNGYIGVYQPSNPDGSLTIDWNYQGEHELVNIDGINGTSAWVDSSACLAFLYETPSEEYACILYADNSGYHTGYAPVGDGHFYRHLQWIGQMQNNQD